MTLYGIDASSAQGSVAWLTVAKTCGFGFEKVTQGTGYLNPFWSSAKNQLLGLQKLGKFVPGCYLFLEEGNGAAQADYFAEHAGNLDNWILAIDAEPTKNSNPRQADLNSCVTQLRKHFPHNQIAGYCPGWYWGSQELPQFDWLWNSHYVSGVGTPPELYSQVPASWWADYGGKPTKLLQFTSTCKVAGVAGTCDCSAFRGTLPQLQALTMKNVPVPPHPTPAPVPIGDTDVYVFTQPQHQAVVLPIPAGKTKIMLYADPGASGGDQPELRVGASPPWATSNFKPSWGHPGEFAITKGQTVVTLARLDAGNTPVTIDFV